jgi:hypothetical protein
VGSYLSEIMANYIYASNVSEQDRFTQLEIALDNGRALTLSRGGIYDLSAAEAARARSFVVLAPTSGQTFGALSVDYLPIRGALHDGDVPVWSKDELAFVPGQVGGLRFEQSVAAISTSRAHHASGLTSYDRARMTADTPVSGNVDLAAIKVNGTTVATLTMVSGQTSSLATVVVDAVDGDVITITRLSLQGDGLVVELDRGS